MSSTNRGGERHANDYYITPVSEVVKFLNHWNKTERDFLGLGGPLSILDPCAGGDANNPMSYLEGIAQCGMENSGVQTIDIRDDSRASIKGDFLSMEPTREYDMVITNPPFSHALQIIQHAMGFVKDGGVVIMLLRLNFLGSIERGAWLRSNMPTSIHVHSQRMGFKRHMAHLPAKDRNATDSIEYAHFVWQAGASPAHSRTYVI